MTNEQVADRIIEMIVNDLFNHDDLAGQIYDEVPYRYRKAVEALWRHNICAMLPSPVEPSGERLSTALRTIRFAGNNSDPTAVWMQKVAAHAMEPEKWPAQPADPPAAEPTGEPKPKWHDSSCTCPMCQQLNREAPHE